MTFDGNRYNDRACMVGNRSTGKRRVVTFDHPVLPAIHPSGLQHVQCIERGQNLDRADRVQHVWVVARRRTETPIRVLAREDKVHDLVRWQGGGVPEQMQRRQPPVQAAQSKVFGVPIFQVVLLLRILINIGSQRNMVPKKNIDGEINVQCPNPGCI